MEKQILKYKVLHFEPNCGKNSTIVEILVTLERSSAATQSGKLMLASIAEKKARQFSEEKTEWMKCERDFGSNFSQGRIWTTQAPFGIDAR